MNITGKIKDYFYGKICNHYCNKYLAQAKQIIRHGLTLSERSSTAAITTGLYGYYKLAKNASEYGAMNPASTTIGQRLTTLFTGHMECGAHKIIPLPSLAHASLILLAAHTVSSVDIAFRNIAEDYIDDKSPVPKGFFARLKSAVKKPKHIKEEKQRRGSDSKVDIVVVKTAKIFSKANTQRILLAFDSYKAKFKKFAQYQAIRTIPGLGLSLALAPALGFAASEGAILYGLYRTAVLAKEAIVNFSKTHTPPTKAPAK